MSPLLILVILVALGILALFICSRKKTREGFKVLGTLGNQAPMYYQCLSECERTDHRKQMGMTHGNMMCQSYCESAITDIVRRAGPSFPNDFPLPEVPVTTRIDDSFKKCGEGTKGEWCRSLYTTDGEIDARCRQNCEFSTDNYPVCMNQCIASFKGNRYMGWSWK